MQQLRLPLRITHFQRMLPYHHLNLVGQFSVGVNTCRDRFDIRLAQLPTEAE